MNNKVLVTGGTGGFVGMRIISRLLEQGYEDFQTTIRDLNVKLIK